MSKLALLVPAFCLALSACGGGDTPKDSSKTESSTSPTASPSANPADQSAAEQSLLVLQDFPSGWEAQTADGEDSELDKHQIAECVGVEYEEMYDDSNAKAESRTFVSPDDVEVDHEVFIAADEDWVRNAFELTSSDKFRNCVAEEMENVLVDALEEEDEAVELGDLTVNEMGFESYGDATTALRVTIPFETQGFSLESTLDIVAVRVGRAESIVTAFATGSGLTADELAEFVVIGTDRLQQSLTMP